MCSVLEWDGLLAYRRRGDHISFLVWPERGRRGTAGRGQPKVEGRGHNVSMRVIIALLCSYENVGSLDAWLEGRAAAAEDEVQSYEV